MLWLSCHEECLATACKSGRMLAGVPMCCQMCVSKYHQHAYKFKMSVSHTSNSCMMHQRVGFVSLLLLLCELACVLQGASSRLEKPTTTGTVVDLLPSKHRTHSWLWQADTTFMRDPSGALSRLLHPLTVKEFATTYIQVSPFPPLPSSVCIVACESHLYSTHSAPSCGDPASGCSLL